MDGGRYRTCPMLSSRGRSRPGRAWDPESSAARACGCRGRRCRAWRLLYRSAFSASSVGGLREAGFGSVAVSFRCGRSRYHVLQTALRSGVMTSPIITEAVRQLVDRKDLSRIEAAAAMEAIMSGAATNAQIAAFLTALRMKGETVEELIGFAQVMRQKAVRIRVHDDG